MNSLFKKQFYLLSLSLALLASTFANLNAMEANLPRENTEQADQTAADARARQRAERLQRLRADREAENSRLSELPSVVTGIASKAKTGINLETLCTLAPSLKKDLEDETLQAIAKGLFAVLFNVERLAKFLKIDEQRANSIVLSIHAKITARNNATLQDQLQIVVDHIPGCTTAHIFEFIEHILSVHRKTITHFFESFGDVFEKNIVDYLLHLDLQGTPIQFEQARALIKNTLGHAIRDLSANGIEWIIGVCSRCTKQVHILEGTANTRVPNPNPLIEWSWRLSNQDLIEFFFVPSLEALKHFFPLPDHSILVAQARSATHAFRLNLDDKQLLAVLNKQVTSGIDLLEFDRSNLHKTAELFSRIPKVSFEEFLNLNPKIKQWVTQFKLALLRAQASNIEAQILALSEVEKAGMYFAAAIAQHK